MAAAGATQQPLLSLPQSSQKKSCSEEPEPEPEATEGDGDKKGNAEGSSDEEGKLVIDEPTKEKNEKGALKRRAGDLLEVTATCLGPGTQTPLSILDGAPPRHQDSASRSPQSEREIQPLVLQSLAEKTGHRKHCRGLQDYGCQPRKEPLRRRGGDTGT